MTIAVERGGFLTTVQDLGRTGWREHGVSTSGALDRHALRVANVLVGNGDGAAGLEMTLGRVRLRAADTRLIAWCGGDFEVRIGDALLPAGHVARVARDEEVTIDAPKIAARAWLAVSGGIDVPPVLGSRSTDIRARFGGYDGRALRDADILPLGKTSEGTRRIELAIGDERVSRWTGQRDWVRNNSAQSFLRVLRGVDWPRFSLETRAALLRSTFVVTPESDRMGARLRGVSLRRIEESELLSEPVAPGTIQVPPDGNPILLLNDCQTIGGYPKIAHVITVDLSAAASLQPGDSVRFHEVTHAAALAALAQREKDFERFRLGISLQS